MCSSDLADAVHGKGLTHPIRKAALTFLSELFLSPHPIAISISGIGVADSGL